MVDAVTNNLEGEACRNKGMRECQQSADRDLDVDVRLE